jgi:hypothetical protein
VRVRVILGRGDNLEMGVGGERVCVYMRVSVRVAQGRDGCLELNSVLQGVWQTKHGKS